MASIPKNAIFVTVKKSCLLLLAPLLFLSWAYGQDDKLIMISSAGSRIQQAQNRMINYRPVYQHKGSTLSADSGYIYQDTTQRTFFEGFGRVIITQPNGTVVYADKLHYTEDTQVAVLTNNVRMIDAQSVLTTNYLTYNMRGGVGTYTGGGRIVNETDTITSQNAYYFDNTQDAYFRHNVVVRTPNTKIYTDTMRYNTASKMVYFYGPTNIKGEEEQNLYTESGEYNTVTEHARFGKNNLYTEGSRFLTGDSLYYDGDSGNGRAVHNVLFIDTADVFYMSGGLGLYDKANESITMTRNPLVITVTREQQAPADSLVQDSVAGPPDRVRDSGSLSDPPVVPPDSLTADSLTADSLAAEPIPENTRTDSIYMTADTLFSQLILLKDYVPMNFDLDRDGGEIDDGTDFGDFEDEGMQGDETLLGERFDEAVPTDSLGMEPADSLRAGGPPDESVPLDISRDVMTDSVSMSYEERAAVKENIVAEALSRRAQTVPLSAGREILERNLAADSILRATATIPTGREVDSLLAQAVEATKRIPADSLLTDSLAQDTTTTTRIIKAYRNVRLFKSDLQAVADSAYYGYPDSMLRFFGSPMVWAQGSQMSSDTMYMQIVNEKLDNLLLLGNAFLVNTGYDSTKFNQIKGRKITGFFTNNELERLFVDGNAESIYYTRDDDDIRYQDMYHSRSSRIKLLVENNEITQFIPIRAIEGKFSPLHLVTQEAEILSGFVWKPGDRPTSKEDLLTRKREIGAAEIPTDSAAAPPATETATQAGDSVETPSADPGLEVELTAPDTLQAVPPDSILTDSVLTETLLDSIAVPDSVKPVIDMLRRDTLRVPLDSIAAYVHAGPPNHAPHRTAHNLQPASFPQQRRQNPRDGSWTRPVRLASAAPLNQRVKTEFTGS